MLRRLARNRSGFDPENHPIDEEKPMSGNSRETISKWEEKLWGCLMVPCFFCLVIIVVLALIRTFGQ